MGTGFTDLYKPVERRILELLQNGMGDAFHAYFDGEPVALARSLLPALIVDLQRSEPLVAATRQDKWRHTITVKIAVDKMDDANMGQATGASKIIPVPSVNKLRELIFARGMITGNYVTNSVMGVLRRNMTMEGAAIDQTITAEWGINERPGFDNVNVITSEVHLTLQITETINVLDRT